MICTLGFGSTNLEEVLIDAYHYFTNSAHGWNPLLHERLPRFIVLACSGAALSLGGAVIQSLFQNPLASPSVLGMGSGGALASTIVFISGWHLYYPFLLPLASSLGCLAALVLVWGITYRYKECGIEHILLTGIAISTTLMALQGAIVYALRDQWSLVQTLTEWNSGSSCDRSWIHVHMVMPLCIAGIYGIFSFTEELNILALGQEEACNLGVQTQNIRWRLFIFVSLLTGGAQAAIGSVAFFGLILPHLSRQIVGPDHKILLPFSAIWGGISLAGIDITLRILGIHSLSLGTISAILGGLFFLFLLFRQLNTAEA